MKNVQAVSATLLLFSGCLLAAMLFTVSCDSSSSPSDDSSPSPIVRITPEDGATGVAPNTDIVIQFNTSLDPTVIGQVYFHNIEYSEDRWGNCTTSITTTVVSNDTLTLNPGADFPIGECNNISIYNFEDSEGNDIDTYSDPGYSFTVVP